MQRRLKAAETDYKIQLEKGPGYPRQARHEEYFRRSLGFPDAETHQLKAELVTRIQGVISA